MTTTETTCHCGAEFGNSDHCHFCGCEQFESTCDETHTDEECEERFGFGFHTTDSND